jgi:tetratricopeptide (TPR) repeat protein
MSLRPLALALSLCFSSLLTAQSSALPAPIDELRTLIRSGNLELAIEKGESLVETRADDALAWLWLGRAYGRQAQAAGLLSKASWAGKCREAFETSVKLDGGNIDARWDLMQFYLQAPGFMGGGVDKARAQASAIGKVNAGLGHLATAAIAQSEEEKPAAIEAHYRQALAAAPRENRIRLAWSAFLTQQQQWDELFGYWQAELDADPGDAIAKFQYGRGAALSGKNLELGLQYMDALLAREALPAELILPAVHWRRGLILEKLGRRDDAVDSLKTAVSLDTQKQTEAAKDLDRIGD